MADDRLVTERELDLKLKNSEQALNVIKDVIAPLNGDIKLVTNTLNAVQREFTSHIAQDQQERERRKERWTPWQLAILTVTAAAAIGMFVVVLTR